MTDAEMDALAAADKGSPPQTLSDADMDALAGQNSSPPATPPPDTRSFLARGWDTVKSGAHAVGHVAADQANFAARALAHPIDTFGTPEARAQAEKDFVLTNPSKRRELERGVGDVVTLGYANKAAEAVDKATGENKFSQAQQQTDAENAPEYRGAGQMLGSVLPNPVGKVAGIAGKAAGATAARLAPGVTEALGSAASHVPGVIAAPVRNVASYEATAPASAALSSDAEGHRLEAAKTAALDPAGLMLSTAAGAIPAAAKGTAQTIRSYVDRAPAAEATNLMTGVMAGEGKSGRATVKQAKLLDRAEPAAVEILRSDKELREASNKPAKEALPVFHEKLAQVGSQLDPHYDVVDKATGGVSMHNLVNFLDDEAATYAKKPLNEQYERAVNDIKRSALKAWAPGMEDELAARKRLTDMGLQSHKDIPDVLVPTRDVREMVTRLQKRGTEAINALNPGESTQMKADMAGKMKDFIDSHLDVAAEQSPQVAQSVDDIRNLNRQYNAISTMSNAIEQRKWKETTGGQSLDSKLGGLLKHGGAAMAVPMLLHGNIPGAVGAVAAPHLVPLAGEAARGITNRAAELTRSPAYPAAIQRLAAVAKVSTNAADFVAQAVRAGMGPAAARRIYEAAHPTNKATIPGTL